MSQIRLFAHISLLVIASMCYAQALISPSVVNRRVEVLIRSQFSVPSGYEIVFGDKTQSDVPGYDILPVTFVNGGKQTTANFLISKDCRGKNQDQPLRPRLVDDRPGWSLPHDARKLAEILV